MGNCGSSDKDASARTGSVVNGVMKPVDAQKGNLNDMVLAPKEREIIIENWPELMKRNPKLFHEVWTQVSVENSRVRYMPAASTVKSRV